MKIYTVSSFREEMNALFEEVTVAVQGEISDFRISQGRFAWFSLVDKHAVVQCFMLSFQLPVALADGMEVRVIGSPTLFKKGQFVFRPRRIELVGDGTLRRAYELLKTQLEKEGLFDVSRKRTPPRFPTAIGLLTSSDAAAYSDFLRIVNNRWQGLQIFHHNIAVQGQRAINDIVTALAEMNHDYPHLDAIVLTRGGGSLEDLQAFNAEPVARAIFASRIPLVSAVGHERDITLADLVADVRASTPSNAAERMVPHRNDVALEIDHMTHLCERRLRDRVADHKEQMHHALATLEHHARKHIDLCQHLLQRLQTRFVMFTSSITQMRERVDHFHRLLQSLNPLHVLERGYTMTLDERGNVITRARRLVSHQHIATRFADGEVVSTIDTVKRTS